MAAITDATPFVDSPANPELDPFRGGGGPMAAANGDAAGALSMLRGTAPPVPVEQPAAPPQQQTSGPLSPPRQIKTPTDAMNMFTPRIRPQEALQAAAEERRGALSEVQKAYTARPKRSFDDLFMDGLATAGAARPWDPSGATRSGIAHARTTEAAREEAGLKGDIDSALAKSKFLQGEEGIAAKDESAAEGAISRIAAGQARNNATDKPFHNEHGAFAFVTDPVSGEKSVKQIASFQAVEKLMTRERAAVQRLIAANPMAFRTQSASELMDYVEQEAKRRVDASLAASVSAAPGQGLTPPTPPTAAAAPGSTPAPVQDLSGIDPGKAVPAQAQTGGQVKFNFTGDMLKQPGFLANLRANDPESYAAAVKQIAGMASAPSAPAAEIASEAKKPIVPTGVTESEKKLAVADWIRYGGKGPNQTRAQMYAAEMGIAPEDLASGRAQAMFDAREAQTAGNRAGVLAILKASIPKVVGFAVESASAIDPSEFVPVNKLMQFSAAQLKANPAMSQFKIAHMALTSDYAQVIAKGGGNVFSQKEAMEKLNGATDLESYITAANAVKREVEIAKEASAEVRAGLGRTPKAAPKDTPKGSTTLTAEEQAELDQLRKRFGK